MLKIYYADISTINPYGEYRDFSSYRLEKLSRLKHEQSRRQGIGAELLLLQAAKENSGGIKLPLRISEGSWGKPCCSELPFKFSISHSGNLSAVAISDAELGFDIQKLTPFNTALALRRFSSSEQDYIEHSPDKSRAFTEAWSMKESYLKAIGTGLRTSLKTFSVLPEREICGFHLLSGAIDNYIFSVCTAGLYEEAEIIKTEL